MKRRKVGGNFLNRKWDPSRCIDILQQTMEELESLKSALQTGTIAEKEIAAKKYREHLAFIQRSTHRFRENQSMESLAHREEQMLQRNPEFYNFCNKMKRYLQEKNAAIQKMLQEEGRAKNNPHRKRTLRRKPLLREYDDKRS